MKHTIFSIRVAKELMKKGHKVLKIEDGIKNPKYKVFIFDATTAEFFNDLAILTNK